MSVTGPAGYTSTLSPDCAGTLGLDERRTCTITHDDRPATLIVIFEVVNDNGGTFVISDFSGIMSVEGGHHASPGVFPAQGSPGTTVTLDPGSYGVLVGGSSGLPWTRDFDPDCAGTIAAGEMKTCTIVVSDVAGTLLVVAEVVNDDGGTAVAGDFTVTVTGGDRRRRASPGRALRARR